VEKGMATHSSILAWRISWTESLAGYSSPWGSQRVGHNWAINTFTFTFVFTLFNLCIPTVCWVVVIVQLVSHVRLFVNPMDCHTEGFPVVSGGYQSIGENGTPIPRQLKEPGEQKYEASSVYCNIHSSVQSLSRVWLFATPWTAARQASLSSTNSQGLLRLMSIGLVMPSNHLILCCYLLLPPSIFPSIRVFSNESALCIRWPKYWSFSPYTDKYVKPKVVPILKKTREKLDFQTSAHRGLRQEQVTFHCYVQESRGSSPKIGTVRTHGKVQRALPGPAWVCLPPWPWSRQAPLTSPASALHAQERRGRDLEGWHPHSRGRETLTPRPRPIPPTWRLSCCSVAQSCPTHCDPLDWSIPGFPVLHCLPEFAQIHVRWIGDAIHLTLCRPLPILPSIFPSIKIFSNELALHIRWPKHWSFSFSISIIPSNEYSELISFRIDWFDLLAVQGTLKSLLQHHNSKASIFWRSAFFMVQLSHSYMTTRKTTALIIWTFVSRVMSLLFNKLSRFVIAFYSCIYELKLRGLALFQHLNSQNGADALPSVNLTYKTEINDVELWGLRWKCKQKS